MWIVGNRRGVFPCVLTSLLTTIIQRCFIFRILSRFSSIGVMGRVHIWAKARYTLGWVASSSQGSMLAFVGPLHCSRAPWLCSENVLENLIQIILRWNIPKSFYWTGRSSAPSDTVFPELVICHQPLVCFEHCRGVIWSKVFTVSTHHSLKCYSIRWHWHKITFKKCKKKNPT